MKKLSFIDKFLVFTNVILVIVLFISFFSYYVSPNTLPFLSVLSLFEPVLILLNIVFIIFWLFKLNRFIFLSIIALLIGFQYVSVLFNFTEKKVFLNNDLKIMSYNVRMFNLYKWIDEKDVDQKIYDFIASKDPDILCIQEFHTANNISFKYPYKYVVISEVVNNFGHAIYSKYKIVNKGSINFSKSGNNAIYVDVLQR